MFMKRAFSATLLALCPAVVGPAFAHDTWMTPERGSVSPGTALTLDMTSGMAFPALDHAIDPDRIERAFCRLGGKTSEIGQRQKGSTSLRLTATLDVPGIATLWVNLKPRVIELKPEQVGEYLEEINATEVVRKAWGGPGDQRVWREIYTKHSKTFVRVGETNDRSWAEPTMMTLEFVPEINPTTLLVGDELRVRLMKNGTPLPDFSVGVVDAGHPHGVQRKTDADGRVVVHLDHAGLWLLRGTELRKSSAGEADWESDFTTLTIEVRPR